MLTRVFLAGALAVSAAMLGASANAAERAALFPFEIIVEDTLEGIPMAVPAEKKRLQLLTQDVAQMLSAAGIYAIADNVSQAAEIEKQSPFFKCNGCEVEIAKKLDAKFAITGLVQKGSATTANISVAVRNVATGELVTTAGITVLENTDEGWLRGVRRLVKSRLIGEGEAK